MTLAGNTQLACTPRHAPPHAATQVSDIKRLNGILNDSAIYGRDSLLVPTKPLPFGCGHERRVGSTPPAPGALLSLEKDS